ncbi:MAG: enoyl-CoA hydratase/isomerase family protein [Actinomycetota bacterium]
MAEAVRLEVSEQVAIIRIDRPPVNALSRSVIAELAAVAAETVASGAGAAVIWGGERVFSAGADIAELRSLPAEELLAFADSIQAAFRTVAELPMVTIAAMCGYAVGGGCELALAADFRFAAESARVGQPEVLLGLIPGAGGTQRLPRLVGPGRAKDLILSGRILPAPEAASIGLVDELHPAGEVLDAALRAARRYAGASRPAIRGAKRAIDRGFDLPLAQALEMETAEFLPLFDTDEWRTASQTFVEKRRARNPPPGA